MAISNNEKEILKELARQLNDRLKAALPMITKQVRQELDRRIRGSDEWSSLQINKLHYELGVDDSVARLESILNVWLKSTQVQLLEAKLIGNGLNCGLKIWGMDTTTFDLTVRANLPSAYIDLRDGSRFPWLEMLLLGSQGIVSGYYFAIPNKYEKPYSRTGGGIMRKKIGATWRVPARIAGTEGDNWVTKSLEGFDNSLVEILERVL